MTLIPTLTATLDPDWVILDEPLQQDAYNPGDERSIFMMYTGAVINERRGLHSVCILSVYMQYEGEADLESKFLKFYRRIRNIATPTKIARQPDMNPYFAHFLVTVTEVGSAN